MASGDMRERFDDMFDDARLPAVPNPQDKLERCLERVSGGSASLNSSELVQHISCLVAGADWLKQNVSDDDINSDFGSRSRLDRELKALLSRPMHSLHTVRDARRRVARLLGIVWLLRTRTHRIERDTIAIRK